MKFTDNDDTYVLFTTIEFYPAAEVSQLHLTWNDVDELVPKTPLDIKLHAVAATSEGASVRSLGLDTEVWA